MNLSDRSILALTLALIFLLGLFSLIHQKSLVSEQIMFSKEFMLKLEAYVESWGRDNESYAWLTHRSSKMQKILGVYGVYERYRPPHAEFQFQNYPVILNILPELRRALEDVVLRRSHLSREYANSLQETILRYVGVLEDRESEFLGFIRNPVIGFREGIRIIVALPLSILGWLGALSDRTVSTLISSQGFGLLTGLISLVSFVSGLMGIMLGWDEFREMLWGLLKAF
jgi:hypothetical protein